MQTGMDIHVSQLEKGGYAFSRARRDKICYLYDLFSFSHKISQNNVLLEILQGFVSYENMLLLFVMDYVYWIHHT